MFYYNTPGSFFRAGLQLLLAEEDNINRSIKVRGGYYTAMAKEGRFVYKTPPFGYKKEGVGKKRVLVIDEAEAKIVKFIYQSYLSGVPVYIIKEKAYRMGFNRKGQMAIERVLSNPAHAGLLYVESFKDHPGGLFPAIHEPIIDTLTWKMVQEKMKKPNKTRSIVDDAIPLRGVLKCHCGNPLTGAASRGKSGKYFYYYKCRFSGHNNINAVRAHKQFEEATELMSVPEKDVKTIINSSEVAIDRQMADNNEKIKEKSSELEQVRERLFEVEEKWIKNEINRDTYERWYSNYNNMITDLRAAIDRYNEDPNCIFQILNKNLPLLSDMKYVYTNCDSLEKREFINVVFDNNLYYQNGIYRTPTMLELLSLKAPLMAERGLLIYEKIRDFPTKIPLSGE